MSGATFEWHSLVDAATIRARIHAERVAFTLTPDDPDRGDTDLGSMTYAELVASGPPRTGDREVVAALLAHVRALLPGGAAPDPDAALADAVRRGAAADIAAALTAGADPNARHGGADVLALALGAPVDLDARSACAEALLRGGARPAASHLREAVLHGMTGVVSGASRRRRRARAAWRAAYPPDLVERRLGPTSLATWGDLVEGWTGPGIRTVAAWRAASATQKP